MQDLKQHKKEIRKWMRLRIASLAEKELEKSDESIYNKLSALPELRERDRIFLYYSVNHEVDTHRLLRLLLSEGKTVALPVSFPEGEMVFARYQPGELQGGSVVPIPEPDASAPRIEPEEGDIIIVPALSFDRQGFRLGQGGGYYDRFLKKYRLYSIGLGREKLLMEAVPREEHDCGVCCLVTENEVRRFRAV